MKNKKSTNIVEKRLSEIKTQLPKTDLVVIIDKNETIHSVAQMLNRIDNTANDNVLVLDNHKPIGIITGKNVINVILNHPEKLDNPISKNIDKNIHLCNENELVSDVIKSWMRDSQYFSIFNDGDTIYAISPKIILGLLVKNNETVNFEKIIGSKIKYITKKNTINEALNKMMTHNIRRLIIEGTKKQFNDRSILKIIFKSNNIKKILSSKIKINISDKTIDMSLDKTDSQILKEMNEMKNPCVINKNYIITCYDIVHHLIK